MDEIRLQDKCGPLRSFAVRVWKVERILRPGDGTRRDCRMVTSSGASGFRRLSEAGITDDRFEEMAQNAISAVEEETLVASRG